VFEEIKKPTEANRHARLSRSKQLLKNIRPMMLASFDSMTKTVFTVSVRTENDRLFLNSDKYERRRNKRSSPQTIDVQSVADVGSTCVKV